MLKENLMCADIDKKLIRQILYKNKENIVGDIRTASYDNDNIVVKQQEDIIMNFCKEFNVNCKEIYIDNGFSGLNYDRPGIKEIINSGRNEVILVSDMVRISRDYLGMNNFTEKINKSIIGITDGIIINN